MPNFVCIKEICTGKRKKKENFINSMCCLCIKNQSSDEGKTEKKNIVHIYEDKTNKRLKIINCTTSAFN